MRNSTSILSLILALGIYGAGPIVTKFGPFAATPAHAEDGSEGGDSGGDSGDGGDGGDDNSSDDSSDDSSDTADDSSDDSSGDSSSVLIVPAGVDTDDDSTTVDGRCVADCGDD